MDGPWTKAPSRRPACISGRRACGRRPKGRARWAAPRQVRARAAACLAPPWHTEMTHRSTCAQGRQHASPLLDALKIDPPWLGMMRMQLRPLPLNMPLMPSLRNIWTVPCTAQRSAAHHGAQISTAQRGFPRCGRAAPAVVSTIHPACKPKRACPQLRRTASRCSGGSACRQASWARNEGRSRASGCSDTGNAPGLAPWRTRALHRRCTPPASPPGCSSLRQRLRCG